MKNITPEQKIGFEKRKQCEIAILRGLISAFHSRSLERKKVSFWTHTMSHRTKIQNLTMGHRTNILKF